MKFEKTLLSLPKAILFDWDGTLVGTFQIIKKSINQLLADFGEPPLSDRDIRKHTQLSAKDGLPLWFGDRWPEALKIFTQYYQKNSDVLQALPGALSLLKLGKRLNIPMAVISNKRGEILRAEISRLGWESFFEVVVGSGDVQEDKPSCIPVHHTLEKMTLVANLDIWFVGDAPVDWQSAEAAGCLAIPIGLESQGSKGYRQFVADCLELEKILLKTSNLCLVN
jgi:phosphoglycolate phosphatase